MPGSELPLLSQWQNFYMLIGTAAATLTGLMFVATSLVAGIETHVPTANAAVSAFNTPTVVHFGIVLLLAGILSAPWQTFSDLSLLLGLVGLGMVLYSIIVLRRMRRVPHYQSTLEDWSWYLALPLIANILLIVAAFLVPNNPSLALYLVGLAMMLLRTRTKACGSAYSYRTCLAVTEAAGDGANHRRNKDQTFGRSCRRSVCKTNPGRGHISGRAVCTASHCGSSVNKMMIVK